MTQLDAPTMDPSGAHAWTRSRFLLHRVYDGGNRGVVDVRHVLEAPASGGDGGILLGRVAEGPGVIAMPDDARASRAHAKITIERDGVRIVDQSKLGTFVDGQRLEPNKAVALADGSVVRAGDTVFVLRIEPAEVEDAADIAEIAGSSIEARVLRSTLAQVAPTKATALLLGETGTGKEVAARALHRLSKRPGAFVPVNCSAIPASLFESELFGHTKGAFTGADKDDDGLVRAAAGGTLFLDEIGELPLESQPKLLRFLDEGAVLGVGARKAVHVDVRVVAATHRDLPKAVAAGKFRGDLYARLAEIVVPLPPLRHRRDDVLGLVQRALTDALQGEAPPPLSPDLAHALVVHAWPFNVREVQKVSSELAVKGRGKSVLELGYVDARLTATLSTEPPLHRPPGARGADPLADTRPQLRRPSGSVSSEAEDPPGPPIPAPDKPTLEKLLKDARGSVSEIARVTGRSRRQVRRWLEKHGLVADDYRQ